jgi:hypothetical protein
MPVSIWFFRGFPLKKPLKGPVWKLFCNAGFAQVTEIKALMPFWLAVFPDFWEKMVWGLDITVLLTDKRRN